MLHGLQSPQHPPLTIEAMAHGYVHALRQVQPRGPYRLCGFSSGGVLAWEAACQLRDAGERVERLLLIDTVPLPFALVDLPLATLALFAAGLGLPAQAWPDGLVAPPAPGATQAQLAAWLDGLPAADGSALQRVVDQLAAARGWNADGLGARFALFRHHVEAVAQHVPRALGEVPVTLLRARHGVAADLDAAAPWHGLCDRLLTVDIPGDHFSCMQAGQVGQWVEHLVAEAAAEELAQ